jgi:hypothetical protein
MISESSLSSYGRQAYETPYVEVVGVVPESFIAASGEVPDMSHGWDLEF